MNNIINVEAMIKDLKNEIKAHKRKYNIIPSLTIIRVGDDPATSSYLKGKVRDCEEVGIRCYVQELTKWNGVSNEDLENVVIDMIGSVTTDGIIVQLPLANGMDKNRIIDHIPVEKDVDCFTKENIGKLFINEPRFYPATPEAVIEILWRSGIKITGKRITVIGRSDLVGKPLAVMLINKGATVTSCNSYTENLKEACKSSDIIVSAVGKPNFITGEMVTPDSIIIDVGINRNSEGKLVGDCSPEVYDKVKAYTPVPGGVGLMTRMMLLKNVINACASKQEVPEFL